MSNKVTWTDPETWEVCSEKKKTITVKSKFFSNKTEMPYYDGILQYPKYHKGYKGVCGEIVLMSPDDYFASCVHARSDLTSYCDEFNSVDMERVNKYYERALNGEKMPIPVIDKKMGSQEGRHRAMVAKKLELKKIPVLVVTEC
jgi:hypothetical protein